MLASWAYVGRFRQKAREVAGATMAMRTPTAARCKSTQNLKHSGHAWKKTEKQPMSTETTPAVTRTEAPTKEEKEEERKQK